MTEFKADMAFKCHICKKIFMNNIEFMKHLSLHVENERVTAVDLVDLSQCKYCLKDFESNFTLQKHLDDDHYKSQSQYICKICNVTFPQATHLILHMQKVHVRAEMVSHAFYAEIQNHLLTTSVVCFLYSADLMLISCLLLFSRMLVKFADSGPHPIAKPWITLRNNMTEQTNYSVRDA